MYSRVNLQGNVMQTFKIHSHAFYNVSSSSVPLTSVFLTHVTYPQQLAQTWLGFDSESFCMSYKQMSGFVIQTCPVSSVVEAWKICLVLQTLSYTLFDFCILLNIYRHMISITCSSKFEGL